VEKAWVRMRSLFACEFLSDALSAQSDDPRGMNVAGQGQLSVFGFDDSSEGREAEVEVAGVRSQVSGSRPRFFLRPDT